MQKATISYAICSVICLGFLGLVHAEGQEGVPDNPALSHALKAAEDQDYDRAQRFLMLAEVDGVSEDLLTQVAAEIRRLKEETLVGYQSLLQQSLSDEDTESAEAILIDLIALGLDSDSVARLRVDINNIREYGGYRPNKLFSDPIGGTSQTGPELLVVPRGRFVMGSSDHEVDRQSHEGPRHRVSIEKGFAMGVYELTVEQFRLFVLATDYQTDAERRGFGQVYEPRTGRVTRREDVNWRHDYLGSDASPKAPVIHVSWRDAQAYVRWLSEVTNEQYRLPSEAEFEYVLRAGSQSIYPWGDEYPSVIVENLAGDGDESPTGKQWSVAFKNYDDGYWGPAPFGQFASNEWGFHDLNGNVMEWTEDCWHDSYVRAPTTGLAWVNPGCRERVIRGGSWAATPMSSRSAFRYRLSEDDADVRVGFRIVRELSHD